LDAKEIVRIAKGTVLFNEGEKPDCMFIIKGGQVGITKKKGNTEVEIGCIERGQVLGEMGFFDGKTRSASAKAMTDVEAIKIGYDKLKALYDQYPAYFKAIIASVVERLRDADNKIRFLEESGSAIDYSGKSKDHSILSEQVLIKIASLMTLLCSKYGVKEAEGTAVGGGAIRKHGLQIFNIPMTKITASLDVFASSDVLRVVQADEGSKVLILNQKILDNFIEWCGEEMFKPQDDRIYLSKTSLEAMKFLTAYGSDGKNVKYKVKDPRDPDSWLEKSAWEFNIVPYKERALKEYGISIETTSFKELIAVGFCIDAVGESADKIFVRYEKERLEFLYPNYRIIFNMNRALEEGAKAGLNLAQIEEKRKEAQDTIQKNEFRRNS
jgi:CRP/FNR family transcriptional regulator, cyclic AMP receptor protein